MFQIPSTVPSGLTHLQTAEKAKSYAWRHDHKKALMLYREAMHQAQTEEAEPIFLRHYTECILESLEAMEQYQDILSYCEQALEHYHSHPPESDLARCDLASIYERRAINAAKVGDTLLASEACDKACELAASIQQQLPVAEKLKQWLKSGLHISVSRISSEQKRTGYFSVRNHQMGVNA